MRSMTGFGRCILDSGTLIQQWEVRSVNGKRLDLKWRLPPAASGLESRFERTLRRHASRGHVDVTLNLQFLDPDMGQRFDAVRARGMLEALEALAAERGERFVPDYNALLAVPSLWSSAMDDMDESAAAELERGLTLALEDWNEARSAEGEALARDLLERVERMEQWTELLRAEAPAVKEERAEALRGRVAEELSLLRLGEPAETRLLQETVILMDRLDVTEELTRLSTHLLRLRELLAGEGEAGRRLDFTQQECFREITTCGNKIPEVQLSRLVVDYKNELEKCREQVQNLE